MSNFGWKLSDEESVLGKTGFAYHLYLLLNFPRAAILDYMTSYGCPIVSHKDALLPNDVTKYKMVVHGKFKSVIRW